MHNEHILRHNQQKRITMEYLGIYIDIITRRIYLDLLSGRLDDTVNYKYI